MTVQNVDSGKHSKPFHPLVNFPVFIWNCQVCWVSSVLTASGHKNRITDSCSSFVNFSQWRNYVKCVRILSQLKVKISCVHMTEDSYRLWPSLLQYREYYFWDKLRIITLINCYFPSYKTILNKTPPKRFWFLFTNRLWSAMQVTHLLPSLGGNWRLLYGFNMLHAGEQSKFTDVEDKVTNWKLESEMAVDFNPKCKSFNRLNNGNKE
jgi:hypothetical protein